MRFLIPPSPLLLVCFPLAAPRRLSMVCSRLRARVADRAEAETAPGDGGEGGEGGKRPRSLSSWSRPRGSVPSGDAAGATKSCGVVVLLMLYGICIGNLLRRVTYVRVRCCGNWSCQDSAEEQRGGKDCELHDAECVWKNVLNEE